MTRIFVSKDAAALALGADKVAVKIAAEAQARGAAVEIIRTGSRGMVFLEPLVEVETPAGRIGYGHVKASDVASLFDAGFTAGGAHALGIGKTEDQPFFARQTRLTFARCGIIDPVSLDDYAALAGWRGLRRAIEIGPAATIAEVGEIGPARARRRGLSDRHQMEDRRRRASRPPLYRLQRRRGR